ncbi:hypothetical protein F511_05986 [Dorcoceras hygrometricum]|uniref:AP2/ERF domain-containing protein n=1 Tax=Dorcoceras hygrometricum TaxID=472368 RepID=A0A2Z7DBU9_9LAMI|nr:hypothetical protein F511_05986 [Dorcoceras hygrometricum]
MSGSSSAEKYKGIRRRKWGKWVSEIRVPGTTERLWLGTYTTPEAAAVAHDVALYCLRGNSSPMGNFNFPSMLPGNVRMGMSPVEVQKAASDAGLAIDARLLDSSSSLQHDPDGAQVMNWDWSGRTQDHQHLNISVDDYLQWSNQS